MRNNDILNIYRDTRDIFLREKGKLDDHLKETGHLPDEATEYYEYLVESIAYFTEQIDVRSRKTYRIRNMLWKRVFSK